MYSQMKFTVCVIVFQVILNAKSISTELKITNTDNKPFSFTTALHTYFHVGTIIPCLENQLLRYDFYT